jgi:hypothetical protein
MVLQKNGLMFRDRFESAGCKWHTYFHVNKCVLRGTQGLEQVYLAAPAHGECATGVKHDVGILFVTCAAVYTREVLPDPTGPISSMAACLCSLSPTVESSESLPCTIQHLLPELCILQHCFHSTNCTCQQILTF